MEEGLEEATYMGRKRRQKKRKKKGKAVRRDRGADK